MKKSILLLTICLLCGLMAADKPEGICAYPDIARALTKCKEGKECAAAKNKAKSIVLSLRARVDSLHATAKNTLQETITNAQRDPRQGLAAIKTRREQLEGILAAYITDEKGENH